MTGLFADQTKFRKPKSDPTLTQLSTLQNYLRTIYNRGEISTEVYSEVQPQSTKPAHAHGLPKTHKILILCHLSVLSLTPPELPINPSPSISPDFNPLTMSSHTLKDSFNAVTRIRTFQKSYLEMVIDLFLLMSNPFLQTSP